MVVREQLGSRRGNIWWLTASPITWSIHFLLCYITVAIYCAKYNGQDGSIAPITTFIVVNTIVALIVIVSVAATGFRRWRIGDAITPYDEPTRGDQIRMIGWATFLLSLLSGVATIFTALVFVLAGSCH